MRPAPGGGRDGVLWNLDAGDAAWERRDVRHRLILAGWAAAGSAVPPAAFAGSCIVPRETGPQAGRRDLARAGHPGRAATGVVPGVPASEVAMRPDVARRPRHAALSPF